MIQGAWVSLTVGFVAVGISVIIGIFMGGISGYYGQSLSPLIRGSIALPFFSVSASSGKGNSISAGVLLLSGGLIFHVLTPLEEERAEKVKTTWTKVL